MSNLRMTKGQKYQIWTKTKPKGVKKYKILDKMAYNSPPSAITSPICNTS